MTLDTDHWLTDSRVYNLIWLGRWIERGQNVARVLLWSAQQEGSHGPGSIGLEEALGMAASVRGITVGPDDSALDMLLTRDSGASLRGCLAAARYNATQVAPVDVIQIIGAAIELLDDIESQVGSPKEVADVMQFILGIFDELHTAIEKAWFHSEILSEEDVYRRFVQQ